MKVQPDNVYQLSSPPNQKPGIEPAGYGAFLATYAPALVISAFLWMGIVFVVVAAWRWFR